MSDKDTALYDRIGTDYATTRGSEPRIARLIRNALGDARSLVNVGAGTGSYESDDLEVLAVEPSAAMIAQRPASAAPALQASAESLPLADDSYDAALAVNTVHHWRDLRAGLGEMARVARQRVVIFLRDGSRGEPFWLEEYLPALDRSQEMARISQTIEDTYAAVVEIRVALPRDCADGLFSAFWARPEMYLEPTVRDNISHFALATDDATRAGLARLRADLNDGTWDARYGYLRSLPELDLGHRLFVGELSERHPRREMGRTATR
jgi:SAM-dependent methyltransferase